MAVAAERKVFTLTFDCWPCQLAKPFKRVWVILLVDLLIGVGCCIIFLEELE